MSLVNPDRFGPITVRSGRFGPGYFGLITGVSRFDPVGVGQIYWNGGNYRNRPVFQLIYVIFTLNSHLFYILTYSICPLV